jgi:hypothetical protein
VSLTLKHNQWPSEFAFALQSLGDESVVDKLIVSALRTVSGRNLVDENAGPVIARFESDELVSKLALLSASRSTRKRSLAAAALGECRSDRSRRDKSVFFPHWVGLAHPPGFRGRESNDPK